MFFSRCTDVRSRYGANCQYEFSMRCFFNQTKCTGPYGTAGDHDGCCKHLKTNPRKNTT